MCLAGLRDIAGGDTVPVIEDALAMARDLGDRSLEGHVENTYGAIVATVAGPAAAVAHFEAARALLPKGTTCVRPSTSTSR